MKRLTLTIWVTILLSLNGCGGIKGLMTYGLDPSLKNIKEVTNNNKAVAHDFRYTFAKQKYKELKRQGKTEKQALREVSRELNHHRESITKYYLKGA